MTKTAQHSVQPTWGTHRVIWAVFVASSFFRFGGESTLPPQAANASRWVAKAVLRKDMNLCHH